MAKKIKHEYYICSECGERIERAYTICCPICGEKFDDSVNNEYGAIQYSNGFNDGFTIAKDTIIQNITKQYSAHNELVPEWLSIGDVSKEKR